jgi:4-amino-4-deoxy-L-arabinose transferase-like glycosyltransferase
MTGASPACVSLASADRSCTLGAVTPSGRARALVVTALLAVVVAGAALRAGEAAAPRVADESVDERFYGRLARGLVVDRDYGGPASGLRHPHFAAPGAPAVFALAYRISPAGRERPSDIPAAYWVLAVVGTALIVVVYGLGALLAGPAAGVVAAALVAVYPPLVRTTGELLSEPLGGLQVTAGVLALVAARHRNVAPLYVLAGIFFGCAVLTRPDLLLVPVAALLIILWQARTRRDRLRSAALALSTLLVVVPWAIFASHRTGDLVFVTQSDATTLFIGTYLPGDGTLYGLKEALADETRARRRHLAHLGDHELPGVEVLETVRARHPHVGDREAFLIEAGTNLRRYGLGDPGSFAGMLVRKLERMWLQPNRVRSPAMRALHLAIAVLAFIGILLGIALARNRELVLLAGVLASATIVHLALVAHARHNLPLMPLLIVGGCAGFSVAVRRRRHPQRNATNASAPVLEPFVGPM